MKLAINRNDRIKLTGTVIKPSTVYNATDGSTVTKYLVQFDGDPMARWCYRESIAEVLPRPFVVGDDVELMDYPVDDWRLVSVGKIISLYASDGRDKAVVKWHTNSGGCTGGEVIFDVEKLKHHVKE